MQIQILGCGTMGEIVLKALLDYGIASKDIFVEENFPERLNYLQKTYTNKFGVNAKSDIIILATKPQDFKSLDFSQYTKFPTLCSIMSGTSIKKIQTYTKIKSIIRLMPNIALSVGRGVVGYLETETVPHSKSQLIKDVFGKIAKIIELQDEEQVDHITALAGSGPAYFYKLAEILKNHAIKDGFSEEDATIIADETLIGAALVLDASPSTLSELKNSVTSRGGTTEVALQTMEDAGIDDVVEKGIQAAKNRAGKL